jgi:hypothetical protein
LCCGNAQGGGHEVGIKEWGSRENTILKTVEAIQDSVEASVVEQKHLIVGPGLPFLKAELTGKSRESP